MLNINQGRSVMENVFTIETLAGKTITSPDYTILIFMLDMSKVQKFMSKDPINRSKWRLIWKKYWQVMKCTWWTSSSLMLLLKSNMTKRKAKTFTQIIEQFKVILFQLYLHYFIWESLSNNYLRWLMKKKTINLCGQTSTG